MSKSLISSMSKLRQRDRDLISKLESKPDGGVSCSFCAQCLDEIPSVEKTIAYCVWCKGFLCSEDCLKQHAKFRLTKSHRYAMGDELKQILDIKGGHTSITAADDVIGKKQALFPHLRTEISIRNKDDPEICSIHASVVLSNGHLILADLKNNKLKLFNPLSKKCLATHALAGGPRDMCLSNVRGDELYALECGNNCILQIKATLIVHVVRTMPSTVEYFGITCWCDGIAVSASEYQSSHGTYELRLLDYDGNIMKKLNPRNVAGLELSLPWYMASSSDGRNILISDYGNHSVTCLDTYGTVTFVYKDEALVRPVAMATGADDDIFIVGQRSHNVHHVSSTGEKKGVMFSSKSAKLEFPGGIAFDVNKDDIFYIQCTGWSDLMQVFNFSTKVETT